MKHSPEQYFYWVFWISSVVYALYCVSEIRTDVEFPEDFFEETWLGKRDRTDFEWESWVQNALKASPFLIVNLLISVCISSWNTLQWWRIIWSSFFLLVILGPLSLIVILQSFVFHLICLITTKKIVPWIACLGVLYTLNTVSYENLMDNADAYLLGLVQSWVLLRNISYSVDVLDEKQEPSLLKCLAHALYLPLLFSGPVILYEDYCKGERTRRPIGMEENTANGIIIGLARYIFWALFLQAWLHFIYANAISFMPWNVYELPISTVYGLVLCLGQYFMMKYTVIYGLSATLGKAEGMEMPPPPKCISRIHLYSDMWRVFDPGLYKFLNRYINVPARKHTRSWFLASLASFAFVYVWHGTALYIFVWASLNWVGIVLEKFVKFVARSNESISSMWESPRVKAAVTTPLLFLAALSNGYFLAGYEVGNVFVLRSYESSWESKLLVFFILYCCCYVSQNVKDYEEKMQRSHEL